MAAIGAVEKITALITSILNHFRSLIDFQQQWLVYVIGLHAFPFGNNLDETVPLTAKPDEVAGLIINI